MIYSYSGVSQKCINETHTTTKGKPYTLNHNPKLVSSTNYLGQGANRANAQGWERDRNKFFSSLEQKNPDMFSRINKARIKAKQSPKVDDKMIRQAPELKPYKGEEMVHHHIGGDGQAVATPKSVHPGYGGIHNEEKKAGITQNCQAFSDRCEKITQKNPKMRGKSVDEFHAQINRQSFSQSNTARTANTSGTAPKNNTANSTQTVGRSTAVRNQPNAGLAKSSGQVRTNMVRGQSKGQNATSSGQTRTSAARTQSSSGQTSVKRASKSQGR